MKVITVSNQKGGVAKTTTAAATANILAAKNNKVLLIDLDPQADLSYYMNVADSDVTMYNVLCKNEEMKNVICRLNDNLHIAPSDILLAGAEQEMSQTGKEFKLRECLSEVSNKYDYVVIDTPPALGILSVNAFTASDKLVIPSRAGIFSVKAFIQLAKTINSIKKYFNPDLYIDGILITCFDQRTSISKEVRNMANEIATKLNTKVYETFIRTTVAVEEAQFKQVDITNYKSNSTVAIDYTNFVNELLK